MITKEKISVYKKYNGDSDAWARVGTLEEQKIMLDEDWYLIDSLIQDVILSHNNLNEKLKFKIANDEVRSEIVLLATNQRV